MTEARQSGPVASSEPAGPRGRNLARGVLVVGLLLSVLAATHFLPQGYTPFYGHLQSWAAFGIGAALSFLLFALIRPLTAPEAGARQRVREATAELHAEAKDLEEVRASAPVRGARADPSDEPLAVHLPLRILVAEDNPVNQKVARGMLGRLGYRPDVVSNGQDALDAVTALGARPYDLVFLDVEMPVLDGLRAAVEIRRRLGDEGPRIVAMTAHASTEDRHRSLGSGMDDHITKPLRHEMLVKVLQETRPRAVVWLGVHPPADADARLVPGDGPVHEVGVRQEESNFDAAVVEGLAEDLGGLDAVRDLVVALEEEAPVLFEELHQGLVEGDPRQVQAAAHTLKSLASTFGLLSVTTRAAELEVLARDEDLIDGELRLLEMMEAYEVGHAELMRYLERA